MSKDYDLDKAVKEKQELKAQIENFEAQKEMAHLQGKEILIIDDDQEFINLCIHNLKRYNLTNIKYVSTELEAIKQLTLKIPDLIILDVMLPTINGFSMGKILREVAKITVPILYVTANRNFKNDFNILDDKKTDHLFKPIDRNLLAEKINELIFS